jgi:hypothetical protein
MQVKFDHTAFSALFSAAFQPLQFKTIWQLFCSKFQLNIIEFLQHTIQQLPVYTCFVWSNIKSSEKSAIYNCNIFFFFENYKNQFFVLFFSEPFFEIYFIIIPLASVSWFEVGGLVFCLLTLGTPKEAKLS